MPIGACSNGTSFSSRACGAWSVATQSMMPERSPSMSAWRSPSVRSGGFIFMLRVEAAHRLVGEGQVVRPDLGGDPHAGRLGRRDRLHRRGARQVLDVHAPVLVAGDLASRATIVDSLTLGMPRRRARADGALVHRAARRERRVLLVQGEHAAAQRWYWSAWRSIPALDDRPAVVGEAERAVVAQLAHLGQLLALSPRVIAAKKPTGMRASRAAASRSARRIGRAVDDRIGVRHRDDRAVAAGGGRARAGLEVLLVLLAGRAQVHVRVDEGRQDVRPSPSTTSAPRAPSSAAGLAELGDLALAHHDVVGGVEPGARIEHARAAHQQAARARGRRRHEAVMPAPSACCGAGRARSGAARRPGPRRGRPCARRRRPRPGRDQGLRRVDDVAGELDAAVDRPGVHQQLARAQAPPVDLVPGGVLAQRGHVGLLHALVLHAQRVDDVGLASSSSVLRTSPPSASMPRGISVGGPASVTFAPIRWKARMFERATRECRTSPTIQIFAPSSAPSRRRSV